jgi:hypothetical protein
MKIKFLSLLTVSAFALLLCLSSSTTAAPKTPASATAAVPAAAPQPNAEPAASPEPHPEIRDAIAALRRAKEHLQMGAHDFGGHRVEAIKATDEALRQLDLCLKFDK